MYQLTALYDHPQDPAAFDKHYREVHSQLAAKVPGLTSFTMSWPAPGPDGAKPPYHLIAVLLFESQDAFNAGMGGPEGKAAVDDLGNFASAGVTLVTGESERVA